MATIGKALWSSAALCAALLSAACEQPTSGSTQGATTPAAETSPAAAPSEKTDPSAAFFAMADRHAAAFLAIYPEEATRLGVSEAVAGEGYGARLSGYSFDAHEKMRLLNEQFMQELRGFAREDLSPSAQINYDVMRNAYDVAARRNQFVFGGATPAGASAPQVGAAWAVTPYMVTQLTGPQITLPRLMQTQQPLASAADGEAYIARLGEFGRVFDEVIEAVRADAQTGVTPPLFVVEGAIGGIESFISKPAAEHPLTTTLASKLAAVEGLDDAAITGLTERAASAVETVVYPAYRRLSEALSELKPQASADAGVWRLGEEGEAYYQMALDAYGAGGMSGAEIHELGLSEVARITAEMDGLLKGLGLENGTVATRLQELADRPGGIYPNTDDGRAELLASLEVMVDEIMTMAPQWFGVLPSQAVEVRRIPVYEQDTSPGGYYSGPSLDGSRPGIYWINLKNTADSPKYGLKTLTYHEAVPGHHFQISLQRAIKDMPLMRNLFSYSEFAEGWALYSEALAKEMGLYEGDPEGDLGRLQAEIFRAARLVVDTGLHHKQWSREQAIDYMVEATGESRASVTREVERYAAIPGQACSYKLGMLRIQELRAKAEAELGDSFDIRAFHDQVLLAGAMPLEVLSARIEAWIDANKAT